MTAESNQGRGELMTILEERSRSGTRNRQAGRRANQQAVSWLQTHGWPNAERELNSHSGDIIGMGDMFPEVTIEPWAQIWKKLRQATRDAAGRGYPFVWKKHNRIDDGDALGPADPGSWAWVFEASVGNTLMLRLHDLERQVAAYEEARR